MTLITTPAATLIFTFVKFNTNQFYNIEKLFNNIFSQQVQFGRRQAQSSSGQPQSSSTNKVIQLLLNKNKIEVENKPIDKEKQKKEVEKSLESIRRFNQINEEIKKSHDEYVPKTKQREKNMRESLLKAETKYFKDEDGESSRDRESSSIEIKIQIQLYLKIQIHLMKMTILKSLTLILVTFDVKNVMKS